MTTEKRTKLLYFGKRDEDIWNALNDLPSGDVNFVIKKALRQYFFGSNDPDSYIPQVNVEKKEEDNPTDEIRIDQLGSLIR